MRLTKLDKAAETAISVCMGAKKKESVLVLTDTDTREIGYAIYKNAQRLGHETAYLEMPTLETNGQEPPAPIAEAMKLFDVALFPTAKSLTHTNARRAASKAGVRIATFPGITKDIMIRGMNADYKKIAKASDAMTRKLDRAASVRITSPAGTDVSFSIKGRKAISSRGLYHKKGMAGNLPTGEAYVAPVEGSAEGVFVVDGSMAGLGLLGKEKIVVEVKDGYATKFSGGRQAKKLENILKKFGKPGRNIAEFGVGTNDNLKLSGLLLEDEKVAGTVHLALGNNISMGGSVDVPIHLDGVILKPSFWLDGKQVMKDGE